MNLNEILLPKLAEWRPADRQILQAHPEGFPWHIFVTVDSGDAYSCRVWEMALRRTVAGEPINLKLWAESIGKRATGLLETLHLVEIDDQRSEALIRSSEPSRRGQKLDFYEVILKATGEATLRRYQSSQDESKRREQVPFTLTHEVLAKVADDLVPPS
ncbi:MAG: hypothetical protein ACJ8FY_14170 [Gemmataceae bacterium]